MNDVQNSNLVYGTHAVEELLIHNHQAIDKVYFNDKNKTGILFELLRKVKKDKIPYACIPEHKLQKMVGRASHQGVVAYRTVRAYDPIEKLWDILEQVTDPLLLLPSSLEDPGNFGAIIRSATAFNVVAILMERKGTVALNATVAKTSAGTIEQMTIIKPNNLEGLVKELKEKGVQVIGADASGNKKPHEIAFTKPTLIITGGEHSGIPPYLLKLCDEITSIPIQSSVESLNVSVAAGVLLYEATKQRSA